MIPVLTKAQAYDLDNKTIASSLLTQQNLMDNAGKAVAQFFCENIDNPFQQKVAVVCGKGNNGGDGIIAHSYLEKYNVSSKIIFCEKDHQHLKLLKKYNVLSKDYSIYSDKSSFDNFDWIIDGIFGIGLSRKLISKYKKIIKKINYNSPNIISIDIPSGMHADAEYPMNNNSSTVLAKYTLSMGFSKIGNYFFHYRGLSGKIINSDIGFSKKINVNTYLIEENDIKNIITNHIYKHSIDKYSNAISIIAGSDNFPGAAILSCNAAFRTGTGYISLAGDFTENSSSIIEGKCVETVLSKPFILSDNILIGPGLNKDYDFSSYLDEYINDENVNILLDASALHPKSVDLNYKKISFIRTPHRKEFFRMFELDDRYYSLTSLINICRDKTSKNDITLLKGPSTFIITNKKVYIIDNAPSILATAGTGDVLSGIIISLLSQGYDKVDATILGTYLHGESANYYMENISKDGMTASDLIDCIPLAFNNLRKLKESNG